MTDMTVKTPWHLWVVGVLALGWNGYAGYDFIMVLTKGAEYLQAYFPPEKVAYYTSMPMWTNVPYAAAVWGGAIASVLLLLRSRWAFHVFALSLLGVVVCILNAYGMDDWASIGGTQGMMMWGIITAIAVFLAWYAWTMSKKGVLR